MSDADMRATFEAVAHQVADRLDPIASPLERAVLGGTAVALGTLAADHLCRGAVRRAMEDMLADVLAPEIRRVSSSREPLGTDGAEGMDEFDDDREWLREFS